MNPKRRVTDALKYVTRYLPVNKRYGSQPNSVHLPQLKNPLLLGTIGLGATATAAAYQIMRNKPKNQLGSIFAQVLEKLDVVERASVRVQDSMTSRRLHVQVQLAEDLGREQALAFLKEVLCLAWNAPRLGPVAIMVEMRTPDGHRFDVRDLGFEGEVAYPPEIYERFGAPDSDPEWKP